MMSADHPQPYCGGFIQFDVRPAEPDRNLKQVRQGLAALAPEGPGIFVLPELWATGFAYESLAGLADRTPEMLEHLRELARRYQIILAGSLPEKEEAPEGARYYNTLYITGAQGVRGSYRKQHLFAPMGEDLHFSAGLDPRPVDTELGRMAALVCYDLRFPELARTQATLGAGVLLVSAQWPEERRLHWQTLLRARAIENQIYVIACNRCGTTGKTGFAGRSVVLGPDGAVLVEAGDGTEQGMAAIDPARLAEARGSFNTAVATPYRSHDLSKIMGLETLAAELGRQKRMGRRAVFTNGCFDILHKGHVTYLEEARRQGDCLVVGLNSDLSIRSIKGPDRPINSEESRARVLAALGCVDYLVLFDEDTPLRLITALMPDVLVKGADWPLEAIVGAREVMAAGGRVVNIPLVDNFSTTSLIDRIKKSE